VLVATLHPSFGAQLAAAVAVVVAGYLIGGIPWALLVGRWTRGIDIREHGSGNIGAANSFRVLGPGPGFIVFFADYFKGVVPMLLALALTPVLWHDFTLAATGIATIVGHTYSPYLGFAGGKGFATAAGVVTVLTPIATAILVPIFFIVLLVSRYVSLGAIVAAVLYPLFVAFFYPAQWSRLAFAVVVASLVIWRHRSNIGRIVTRQERKATLGIFPPDPRDLG
jgi:glycerol-3-phosphate acyltransferase PlsY